MMVPQHHIAGPKLLETAPGWQHSDTGGEGGREGRGLVGRGCRSTRFSVQVLGDNKRAQALMCQVYDEMVPNRAEPLEVHLAKLTRPSLIKRIQC